MSAIQIVRREFIWRVFAALSASALQGKPYIQIGYRDLSGDNRVVSSIIKDVFFSFTPNQYISLTTEKENKITVSGSEATILLEGLSYTIDKITFSRTPL